MHSCIIAIIRKETRELLRDRVYLGLTIGVPLVVMVLIGLGFVLDVKNLPVAVYDEDRSPLSREYVYALTNSEYFQFKRFVDSVSELDRIIQSGTVRAGIVIPPDFSRNLYGREPASIQILIDGSFPSRAEIVSGYMTAINSQFTVAAIAPGGSVSYSSGSTGICTNIGDTFTMIAASGTCIVQYDQAGNSNYLPASQVTSNVQATTSTNATLTVTSAGSGNGTVNSSPAGITCPGDCTETVTSGTPFSLYASPDWKSVFAGWSGACTGTGTCDITMDSSKGVTAIFNVNPLVRMPGPTYYATIQEAYNVANNGDVIEARDQTFTEDLVFARSISVKLDGGKDDTYSGSTGYTSVNGSLSIVNGSVTINNLIIQ